MHILIQDSEGTGKSNLVKVTCIVISKTLLYHCKNPVKAKALLFGSTGISVANVGGVTNYSGLKSKPGRKFQKLFLNNKPKAVLRNRLSEMKSLIIY